MPRSSRHKSHRAHKHSSRDAKERSESEDEREARDLKVERRKVSPGLGDVDFLPGEHGKKRKDRSLDVPEVGDRWNGEGSAGAEEKEMKAEEFGAFEEEKVGKSKSFGAESRSRSSRRHESSGSERREEGSARDEWKRRPEKDLARRDGGGQYGDVKESERERRSSRDDRERVVDRESGHGSGKERERGVEKDKEHGMERERERDHMPERSKEYDRKRDKERRADSEKERHSLRDKSSDAKREKSSYSSTMGNYEEEYVVKGDLETSERPRQDVTHDRGTEKDLKKEIKREEFTEKDKWHGDGRSGDRRIASTDDRSKSGSHHDEKYKEGSSREKVHEEFDKDKRTRNDKYQGERSSRDHASDRSESKYYKDSDKLVENHIKIKIEDNDREATPFAKEHSVKHIDNRGRKRSPDDTIEYADVKPRNSKEARSSVDKSMLENCKLESNDDRGKLESNDDKGRPESIHSNKVELTPSRDHQKNSPVSNVHAAQDDYSSKQAEPICRPLSKDRHHTSSASSGDPASASGAAERMLESQSVESNVKKEFANSIDCVVDDVPFPSQNERTPRSDGHPSAIPSTDKSPSSDRQNPVRKGARRNLDIDEVGQRNSYLKESREHPVKEERGRDFSQGQLPHSEAGRAGSLSHNRTDHISRSSPSHLPPPPPVRHGIDSPSVLRSGEDDGRGQAGDRKPNNHYKRGGDPNLGRGQGTAWNAIPSWPPPVANGFIPYQHGPSGGFLQVPQQFPPPPMFGVRPFMDFNHGGVPLHMHEPPDRFSGHSRPFGWRNPSDDSGPPHMQGWEGNNGIFGNDSHMYGRPEWEQNRHMIGDRGWDMSGSPWKGQSGSTNMEKEPDFSTHLSVDDARTGQSLSVNEQNLMENNEIKLPVDSAGKSTPNSVRKITDEESPEPLKSKGSGYDFCSTYLSKLDISHDLTCPSLYKQCINIVKTEGHEVVGNNVNKHTRDQDFKQGIKMISGSLNFSGKPVFSAMTDAVFKKAVALYKKTTGESRVKLIAVVEPEEAHDSPKILNVENVLPGAPDTNHPIKMDPPIPVGEDIESVIPKAPKTADVDETEAVDTVKGNLLPIADSLGGDMEDSGKISDSGGVEAISAGDEGCEGLMPECLSRIPNSPKSTH